MSKMVGTKQNKIVLIDVTWEKIPSSVDVEFLVVEKLSTNYKSKQTDVKHIEQGDCIVVIETSDSVWDIT